MLAQAQELKDLYEADDKNFRDRLGNGDKPENEKRHPKRSSKESPAVTTEKAIGIAADKIRHLLAREAQGRYEVGEVVVSIKKDPKKYGKSGVERLAESLGVDRTMLYDCATVAETWSEAACKNLLQQVGKTGRRLSWSHLVQISQFKDAKKRAKAVKDVLDHGRTVRELKNPSATGGQKPGQPTQPAPAAERTTQDRKPEHNDEQAVGDAVNGGAAPPTEMDVIASGDTAHLATSLRAIVGHQAGFAAVGARCTEALKEADAAALAGNPPLTALLTQVRTSLASKIKLATELDQQIEKLQAEASIAPAVGAVT